MDRRRLIIIIVVILLLIIAGVAGYMYWQNLQSHDMSDLDDAGTTPDKIATLPSLEDDDPLPVPDSGVIPEDSTLVAAAHYFVERWGTYSNVSNFQNIQDLRSAMTDELYNQAMQGREMVQFADIDDIEYEAYDAQVASIEWLDKSDETATARVTTRRHRITEGTEEPYKQDIVVRFVNENDRWLVSEAVWQ
ncbi:MAG: hypothetical protein ACPGO5_04425 [Patescibacteria group bacterium]